ncbi:CocE/NonD family hydrolase [Chloroflexota bacterium]
MKPKWHELISQPQYKVKAEKDIYVPMRDSIRLAVNVYRPDAEGKFPALFSMSPYGKELQELLLPPQPLEKSTVWDGNIEAGDTNDIVSRGYVHVIVDIRGTGYSEGEYVGINSKREGEDGYDLVEWAAQQPWCDGNVGMVGYSYMGETQLEVAIEQPPHLKAIFPTGVWGDMYRGMAYQGGVLCMFIYGLWDGRGGTSGLAPNNVVSAMMRELPEEELERRRQEALNNPDIRNFPNLYHLVKYPKKNPVFFDLLMNPYDGPFYWERSVYDKYDKVKIPVYSVGTLGHFFSTRGQIGLYTNVNTPKKMMLHPRGFPTRPWREDFFTIIRWHDHWLKGNDTGIMDEPPIKLYVTGVNQWRYADEWPLPDMEPTKFYLRSWDGLSPEPEMYQDQPDCFVQQPLHVSAKRESVAYLSPLLSEDVEVIGPAALYLHATIDQDDTNWIIKLFDVDAYGTELELCTDYLKASHRALDMNKSKPLQPYHPHLTSEPVVPGEIYEYAIEISPIAHVFREGHRIKLKIGSMESPRDPEMVMHWHPHLCSSKTTVHKIYRDKEHQSHLLLPIIPAK